MNAGAWQIADDEAQRMTRAHLIVPKARDQHGRRAMDAPAEKLQQVERRLIRPVDVLEDDERGWSGALELRQCCEEDSFAVGAPASAVSSGPPAWRAISCDGANGRGVNRASHAPHKTRAEPRRASAKLRRSEVLPMPASPVSSVPQPLPLKRQHETRPSLSSIMGATDTRRSSDIADFGTRVPLFVGFCMLRVSARLLRISRRLRSAAGIGWHEE
jgi:hypothetical protein